MKLLPPAAVLAVLALAGLGCTPGGMVEDDDNGGGGGGAGSSDDTGGKSGGVGGDEGAATNGAAGGRGEGGLGGLERMDLAGGAAGADPGMGGKPASGGTAGAASSAASGGTAGAAPGGQGGTKPAAVPCAQRPYCNDFEAVSVGARPAGTADVSGGNVLRVSGDKAYSGSRSLFVQAGSDKAKISIPVPQNELTNPKKVTYLRMMIWLENTPGGVHPAHWDVMGISGSAVSDLGQTYGATVSFGGFQDTSSRFLYTAPGADCVRSAGPQQIPLKKWACVEIKADETAPVFHYEVSIDGESIQRLRVETSQGGTCVQLAAPSFGQWFVPDGKTVFVGWQHYHNQAKPVKLWIDDVVVDEKPIGCP